MPANTLTSRLAILDDLPALTELMALAIGELQRGFLSPDEIEASRAVMGLDTQLVRDGTYFVIEGAGEDGGRLAGCGGWSRRATLYGGDHSADLREPRLLDPAVDAARVRAMYTHPAFVRRGVGRMIIAVAEAAARAEGFTRTELMATLAGEPLYRACGYEPIESVFAEAHGQRVPLIRMGKALAFEGH